MFEYVESFPMNGTRLALDIHKKIDVYSFAMTMYELMFEKEPWFGFPYPAIAQAVKSGTRPELYNHILQKYASYPSIIEDIIRGWHQNPENRPDFTTIVLHLEQQLTK